MPDKKTRFDKQKIYDKLFHLLSFSNGSPNKILDKFYQISEEAEYEDVKYKKHHELFKSELKPQLISLVGSLQKDFSTVLVGAYLSYQPNSVTSTELEDTLSVLSKNIEEISRNIILLNSAIAEAVFGLAETDDNISEFLDARTNPQLTNYSHKYSSFMKQGEEGFANHIQSDYQKNLFSSLQYMKFTIEKLLKDKDTFIDPALISKISNDKNKDYFNKISDHLTAYIIGCEYFNDMDDKDFCESSVARDIHTKLVIYFGEVYFSDHIKKLTYRTAREKYTMRSFKIFLTNS